MQSITLLQKEFNAFVNPSIHPVSTKSSLKRREDLTALVRMWLWKHSTENKPHNLKPRQIAFLEKIYPFLETAGTPYLSVFKIIQLSLLQFLESDFSCQMHPKIRMDGSMARTLKETFQSLTKTLIESLVELSMCAEGFITLSGQNVEEKLAYQKCVELISHTQTCMENFREKFDVFSFDRTFNPYLKRIDLLKTALSPNPQGSSTDYDLAPLLFSPADHFLTLLFEKKPYLFRPLQFKKTDSLFFSKMWKFFIFNLEKGPLILKNMIVKLEEIDQKKEIERLSKEYSTLASKFSRASIFLKVEERLASPNSKNSYLEKKFLDEISQRIQKLKNERQELQELKEQFQSLNEKLLELHTNLSRFSALKKSVCSSFGSNLLAFANEATSSPENTDLPSHRNSLSFKFSQSEGKTVFEVEGLDDQKDLAPLVGEMQQALDKIAKDPYCEKFFPLLQLSIYTEFSFSQANKFQELALDAYLSKTERVLGFFRNLISKMNFNTFYLNFFETVLFLDHEEVYFEHPSEMEIFAASVAYFYRLQSDSIDTKFTEFLCSQKNPSSRLDPLFYLKDPISKSHSPQFSDPALVLELRNFTGNDSKLKPELIDFLQKRARIFLEIVSQSPLGSDQKIHLLRHFHSDNLEFAWTVEDLLVFTKKIGKKFEEAKKSILDPSADVCSTDFFIHSLIVYFFAPFKRVEIEHDLIKEIEPKKTKIEKSSPKTPPLGAINLFLDVSPTDPTPQAVAVLEPSAPTTRQGLDFVKALMEKIHLENEPNFFLICRMLENGDLTRSGQSFYREFFSSIRGWIERMLKVYDPENKSHQLYDLYFNLPQHLFGPGGLDHLDKPELIHLTTLSRLYIYLWNHDEPLVENTFCPLFKSTLSAEEEKKVFKALFSTYMNLALAILEIVSQEPISSPLKIPFPNVQRELSKNTSKLVLSIESVNDFLLQHPIEEGALERATPYETFSEHYIRLSKIQVLPTKIAYHLSGLEPLLSKWNANTEISYAQAHHILYRLSILLESGLDLALYFSKQTDASGKRHVIFETYANRPLGFSHDTFMKFCTLSQELKEQFTPNEISYIRDFSNFSNSVYHYQDRSEGVFKNYLDTLQSLDGSKVTPDHEDCKNYLNQTGSYVLKILQKFLINFYKARTEA